MKKRVILDVCFYLFVVGLFFWNSCDDHSRLRHIEKHLCPEVICPHAEAGGD